MKKLSEKWRCPICGENAKDCAEAARMAHKLSDNPPMPKKPSEKKKSLRNVRMPEYELLISVKTRNKEAVWFEITSLMGQLCKDKVIGSSYMRWIE